MCMRRHTLRSGYTLVELIVASASSMLLLAGMGASIFIASKAFDESDSQAFTSVAAGNVADEIMTEMQYATRFHERTPYAVTFGIPDRDGDGSEEKLRYAWSGVAGDPLTKQLNGSDPPAVLVDDVQNLNFNFDFMTRTLIAPPPVVVNREVVFEEFTEAKATSPVNSLAISKPAGTLEGDLLIAAVAVKGDVMSSLSAPAGWNEIYIGQSEGKVTFGVWSKNAAASDGDSDAFSWSNNKEAYGWSMRFSGHDSTNPINAWSTSIGASSSPSSPAVTTAVDDTMIVRLGGFENKEIYEDAPGLQGHSVITMDQASKVSGGGGYLSQSVAGTSGTSSFNLKKSKKYVTVTIAIAPAP